MLGSPTTFLQFHHSPSPLGDYVKNLSSNFQSFSLTWWFHFQFTVKIKQAKKKKNSLGSHHRHDLQPTYISAMLLTVLLHSAFLCLLKGIIYLLAKVKPSSILLTLSVQKDLFSPPN